jgi:acetyl/propionyl-CoA carboxylase alpha subunit
LWTSKLRENVEEQFVGDERGNTVALNGHDHSTQRRFQRFSKRATQHCPAGHV